MFKRKTTYKEVEIKSERFVSHYHDNLLAMKYEVKALKDIKLNLTIGMDENIYEINGPHFPLKEITLNNNVVCFKGKTNSNKRMYEQVNYHFPSSCIVNSFNNGLFDVTVNVCECISREGEGQNSVQRQNHNINIGSKSH